MKANSRRTSQSKYYVQLTVVTALALLVLFFLPRVVYLAAATVMLPVNATKTWFLESSASLPQFLRDRAALLSDLESLKQQVAAQGGDQFTVQMLAKENAELRELMGDNGDDRILAGIIGRPNTLPYDMLMLDQGSVDGVVAGAPVYIGKRTVIGFVQSVSERTSLVTLITSPSFKSTVYVLGPDIYTSATGIGGGQLRVGVPQGFVVKEGDLVILPAVTSGVYGAVTYVEDVPSQPEQYAYVSPKIPLSSLRLVAVGVTPIHEASFAEALENVTTELTDIFTVPIPPEYRASSTLPVATTTTIGLPAATATDPTGSASSDTTG